LAGGINQFAYADLNPINKIDPDGFQPFTGVPNNLNPFGLPDWLSDEFEDIIRRFPKYLWKRLEATGQATEGCLYCTAKCMVTVILPSATQTYFLRNVLLEATKGVAKQALKKAIPIYNVADTIVTAGLTIDCVINCEKKE